MSQKAFSKLCFCFSAVVCLFANLPELCFAAPKSIPVRKIQIQQEHSAKNGVLVSRPLIIDQTIAGIVSQNKIRTIEDYAGWLEKTMTYRADAKEDDWLTPLEFLKTKHGDCEDFAFFNSAVLKVLGFSAHIITLSSSRNSHAICAFEHNGKFYWLDNAKLKSSSATNLVSFAEELTNTLRYAKSFKLDPVSKRSTLLYQKT